jgi:hypothetical protein
LVFLAAVIFVVVVVVDDDDVDLEGGTTMPTTA